jgi:hypothetical protein
MMYWRQQGTVQSTTHVLCQLLLLGVELALNAYLMAASNDVQVYLQNIKK